MLQSALLAFLITANTALQEWRLRQVRKELAEAKGEVHHIAENLPGDPWSH